MIEDKQISAHYGRLSVEDTTPIGCRALLSQADIDSITNNFLPIDREARINGSLEGVAPDNIVYACFEPDMISNALYPLPKVSTFQLALTMEPPQFTSGNTGSD